MASGADHYRDAERVLEDAKAAQPGSDQERFLLAAAQIHATLAQAAATALTGAVAAGYWDEQPDLVAWVEAAGVKPDVAK
ncbi:hypothetical protein [Sphaerimonospora thailandensis]|nr:hypothetical protein [Sphaerimonospora thailandensis]